MRPIKSLRSVTMGLMQPLTLVDMALQVAFILVVMLAQLVDMVAVLQVAVMLAHLVDMMAVQQVALILVAMLAQLVDMMAVPQVEVILVAMLAHLVDIMAVLQVEVILVAMLAQTVDMQGAALMGMLALKMRPALNLPPTLVLVLRPLSQSSVTCLTWSQSTPSALVQATSEEERCFLKPDTPQESLLPVSCQYPDASAKHPLKATLLELQLKVASRDFLVSMMSRCLVIT
ncbi:uncharacterized protein LOC111647670 [Seriola lalandi dorsalis]|uniref:uncharacterized protein LOC111647670 n=1 Tax=Seriola lalandi dorsalis TaxID=1841481 RepID=UPI000C6F700A|nr:uncharacterized protein LOC111647670 [Seriola lalandi dorsalis]